jgi:tRNA nucleotidyltransferase (CCA-adding enzyme)
MVEAPTAATTTPHQAPSRPGSRAGAIIPRVPVIASDQLLNRLRATPEVARLLSIVRDGPPAFVVGGTIRDLLLGLDPLDLDVVVDGPLTGIVAALGPPLRAHDQFETATVMLGDLRCDLARSRAETYRWPGALPQVRPAPIEQDLLRRDFTVNAIALSISGERAGELLSAPRALDDLDTGRLRVLHRGSFRDDPTRLLRMVRYASRLRFAVEASTYALVSDAVSAAALRTVAAPRVGAELWLLAAEPDPVAALAALAPYALDAQIKLGFGLDGPEPAASALALLEATNGDRGALALAVASLGIDQAGRATFLGGLGFDAARRDLIAEIARTGPPLAPRLRRARAASSIAAAVGRAPVEAVALAGALGAADNARRWIEQLRLVTLSIGGADLAAAGIPTGPAIGAGLRAALSAKLDGRAGDRDEQLAEALRVARAQTDRADG